MSFLLEIAPEIPSISEDSLQSILDNAIGSYRKQQEPDGPPLVAWLFMAIPTVLVSAVYFRGIYLQRKLDKLWKKGIFPDYKEYERDYLLEAYLRMGTLLIINDRTEIREKQKLILAHAHKYFPEHDIDLGEFILKAFKYPVKHKTAAQWIRKFIRNKNSRLQFIYFLVGIATKDGNINYREEQIIREFGIEIGLSPRELDRLISIHSFKEKRKTTKSYSQTSMREIACKILGISTSANQDEIKKNYRSLVKKYHPDKMVGSSANEMKIAREKFMEVQKAYDFLMD